MMSSPVGHHTSGVFPVIAPVRKMLVHSPRAEDRIVRTRRGRPKPPIPIQTLLQRLLRQIARAGGSSNIDNHLLDLSNTPVSDQFTSFAEFRHGALHRPGLKNPVVFTGGFDHGPRFMNRERKWLFAVNIFACFARRDGDECVPMVGHGDHHRVDILAGQ